VEGEAVNPGAQWLVTRGRPALVIGWALAKDVGLVPWWHEKISSILDFQPSKSAWVVKVARRVGGALMYSI